MTRKSQLRFLAIATLAALAVTLTVALPGVSADGGENPKKDTDHGQEKAAPLPEKTALKYPQLGSNLDQLVRVVEEGKTTAEEAAADSSGAPREESVVVTIYLSANVDDVVGFLEDNGGDPRNVGEDYIEAYVPVSLLGPVSEQPGVIRVREIVPPQPAQSTPQVAGHGPAAHLSAAWNQAGYTGRGVKVGIIDLSFKGFSGLMGTELPATVVARCYTDIGVFTRNLSDCESDSDHGTIVAESLVDIAPEVSLYIANPSTKGDLQRVVDWMIAEEVSVINASSSWTFDGPGNGTSPFSFSPLRAVDRAVANGAVWVNAAGNHARRTWFGEPSSFTSVGNFMHFGGSNWENDMLLERGQVVRAELRWDDSWGGATRDFDLFIFDEDIEIVASSSDTQSGRSGHYPHEFLSFTVPNDGVYSVLVQHDSGSLPAWAQLVVSSAVPSLEHHTGNGSIRNPAESANTGMLAVGAAPWNDVRALEPYSSRGPTPDGRVKPDVVGTDCGVTALSPLNEYNEGFCGTSQATSHVAGMAALVKQRFPGYTPAQVAAYPKDFAEQREGPDPNNTWGHGFAILPPPDGTAQPAPPTLSTDFTRSPAADFDGLTAAGNIGPQGIWSDGTTMWVADFIQDKIYAYDMATKERAPREEFNTLTAAGNSWPVGIWSDGTTMWAADLTDAKIYAYDMATKQQAPRQDFNSLTAAGNSKPRGIWSDGTTMWVADSNAGKLYAYDMVTKARVPGKDFNTLRAAGNTVPWGIWSDGTTMWTADWSDEKIYAYDVATKARVSSRDFNTLISAGNSGPQGIWSDETTMWVADWLDEKLYAYHMPQVVNPELVVETPTVDNSSPAAGASFTLSATVRNQGSGPSAPTTLRYYLSTDSTITGGDTELGADAVGVIAASGSSPQSLGLTAPSTAGTYYYGACVDAVAGETDTTNNCSTAVAVTVATTPGAPTGLAATANGETRIDLSWSAPANNGGAAITGYRIEVSTDGSSWSDLVADTNSTGTAYAHTGLTLGDARHYRVSAINSEGTGPPSNVATATTSSTSSQSVSATRTFSTASVSPGGQVTVTITAANYGGFGRVTETLPTGFTYVSSSLPDSQVTEVDARTIGFILQGDTSFTYTVTASSVEDSYTFSGTLRDSDRDDHVVGGSATVTVSAGDPLIARYDANGNGAIEKSEVIQAIDDYLFGEANAITKADVIRLIDLYLFG